MSRTGEGRLGIDCRGGSEAQIVARVEAARNHSEARHSLMAGKKSG